MTTQNTSTPVKVPASAASYTNATQDPDLRSQINQLLMKDGLVTKIQDHLLHTLNAHPSNWPTTIQDHALSLLRSGEVTTFPQLLRRVIEDVRHDTAVGAANGTAEVNGKKSTTNGETTNRTGSGLAVPQAVVEDALKVTRESLEGLVAVEGDGA